MRAALAAAHTAALFLLAACTASPGYTSSPPAGAAQARPPSGNGDATVEERGRAALRGLIGTLFRDVTLAPP